MYTREQKQRLLAALRALKAQHVRQLLLEADRIAKSCERRVARRLNKANAALHHVTLQQVLDLERTHSPTMEELRLLAGS